MIDGTEWVWFSLKLHKRRVLPSSGHHDGQTPVQRADLALMTFSLVLTLKPCDRATRGQIWGLWSKSLLWLWSMNVCTSGRRRRENKTAVPYWPGWNGALGKAASRRVSGVQLVDDLWVRRDQALNKHTHITGFMKPLGDRGNGARVTFDRRCVCVCVCVCVYVCVRRC